MLRRKGSDDNLEGFDINMIHMIQKTTGNNYDSEHSEKSTD